jgi:hypothetical protein
MVYFSIFTVPSDIRARRDSMASEDLEALLNNPTDDAMWEYIRAIVRGGEKYFITFY